MVAIRSGGVGGGVGSDETGAKELMKRMLRFVK